MKLNRWLSAFLSLTLALVASLAIVGCGGKDPKPTARPEGPETGVYYYDADGDEHTVTLNGGNKFTFVVDGVNKSGEFTVAEDGTMTFAFDNDAVTVASATLSGNVLTVTYNGAEMRFLKKIAYTVNFESNGGSSVAPVTVINGRTVDKPEDPTLENNVFLGWYADDAFTTPFAFDSTIITADTTVYAQWAPTAPGQQEYVVDLVDGEEVIDVKTTIGGQIYHLPEMTKEGATFAGWWISMYEDGEKLTYQYTNGMVFTANTTLYAVWSVADGTTLPAPAVSVNDIAVTWARVEGALSYKVTITDQAGAVITTDDVGSTTLTVDFASLAAGDYKVEVIAVGAVAEENSVATVRYYKNKALGRVSVFTVIDPSTLIFNGVENATKYLITVDCGNPNHVHTDFDNGNSTYFNFSNCAMQEGGIVFTVTAVAEGYASTKSEAFVYNRQLDAVTGIALDAATETLSWNAVANATNYVVTVTRGEETVVIDNGASTSYCLKAYAAAEGGIKVTVTPKTKGYNSPEAVEYVYEKPILAAPTGLTIDGMILSWNAVEGATSYNVKIAGKDVTVSATELDLSTIGMEWDSAKTYEIAVLAIGSAPSLYSDSITATYLAPTTVSYAGGVVSWKPVIGATAYQVVVNAGSAQTVVGQNSLAVALTQAGVNKIQVRYMTESWSNWSVIEVYAHTVTFDTRSGSGVDPQYKAVGDPIDLPTDTTREGFDFTAWYNTPTGPVSNGAEYTDSVYSESGDIVLYAYWTPKTYYITLYVDETVTNLTTGDKEAAVYSKNYSLTVPVSTDETRGYFSGWYTLPGGAGTQLTDKEGNSVAPYGWTRDLEAAYPFFETGVLAFEAQGEGENLTYLAKKGEGIDTVSTVTIPSEYKGAEVVGILENGFAYSYELEVINFPNTFTLVGTGAFNGCSKLREINVEVVEGPHEVFFWSEEGVLMRKDSGTNYLEIVPRGKTGDYKVSETVENIRARAFYYSSLTSVEIPGNVSFIGANAFYTCRQLTSVKFTYATGEDGEVIKPLTMESNAFYNCPLVEEIYLPARLEKLTLSMLNQFPALKKIDVEQGSPSYSSVNNMLCNAAGNTILYCPLTIGGVIEIPVGITSIGNSVFQGRSSITEVIIPSFVTQIGDTAFQGCSSLTKVTFKGSRSSALKIGTSAFAGCKINEVVFEGNDRGELDGAITIGASAFANNAITKLSFKAGSNIAEIGSGAFANAQITQMGWDEAGAITKIGANAFNGCTNLTSIVIPATTVSVGDKAFEGCTSLRSITFAPNGQNIQFGSYVFGGCVLLKEIHLPANVTSFDGSVFDGCDSITDIVVDPANDYLESIDGILYDDDVTEIMYYPKGKDGDLSKLPATLTTIGGSVFQNNPKITTVTLSANITKIGARAFNSCVNLTEVKFADRTAAISLGDYAFANCALLETVVLPEGITTIGNYAFYRTPLTAMVVPSTATRIGDYAFAYTYIDTINIPASVTYIGNGALSYCLNLEEVVFSNDQGEALTIGGTKTAGNFNEKEEPVSYHGFKGEQGTFFGSPKLTSLAFPARLVTLSEYSVYGAENIATVTFGGENSQINMIGQYAFYGTSLSEITFGERIQTIGGHAFEGLTGLTNVTLPASTQNIGQYAFANTGLTNLTVEAGENDSSLTLNQYAFANTFLTVVNLPARINQIGAGNFKPTNWNGNIVALLGIKTVFEGVPTLTDINIEEGSVGYSSVNGVVYNAAGTELLYVPTGKTGEYIVPNTVTLVHPLSFLGSHLTKVTFEEFDKEDPNYGQPLLTLGTFNSNTTSYSQFSVFGGNSTIEEINLPSHLKTINSFVFARTPSLTTINFNQDAVINLSGSAFQQAEAVTALHLPKVEAINGTWTFYYMKGLKEITFGEGTVITQIGDFTFSGCESLETFVLPATVTKIGWNAFSSCSSLTSWTVEEGSVLDSIGNTAFQSCDSLVFFKIPDTVTKLGKDLFNYSESLETIEIPASLQQLPTPASHESIFGKYGMPNFKEIIVPEENTFYESIDGVLYDEGLTTLIVFPRAKDASTWEMPETVHTIGGAAMASVELGELTIPEGIETIKTAAFASAKINVLNLPTSLVTIDSSAFNGVDLYEVNFAENGKLTTIGQSAFQGTKLVNVVIPDTVETIGNYAFSGCMSLKSIQFPNNAKFGKLPDRVLSYTSYLETVIIPANVKEIVQYAFYQSGVKHLDLPASVMTIGRNAFERSSIETITFAPGSKLTTIGQWAFWNSKLQSIVLPDALTSLGKEVFLDCVNLQSIVFGSNLAEIPANTFSGCVNLAEVTLPANLTTIGDAAFKDTAVTSIVIPATVATIGNSAFEGCANLAEVKFEAGTQIASLGATAIFKGTSSLTKFDLPATVTELGEAVFQGSGLTSFVLNSNMKEISPYLFADCVNFTEIIIPDYVTAIGESAFDGCINVTKVQLPLGVETLGSYAFANCSSLTDASVPASVTNMGQNPFSACPNLAVLNVSEENEAFYVDPNGIVYDKDVYTLIYYPAGLVGEVVFPETVRVLAGGAFAGSSITSITLPDTIKEIPANLFKDCQQLTEVIISKSITTISEYAFNNCDALETITIPATVDSIGARAFYNCDNLSDVVFAKRNSALTLGEGVFENCLGMKTINLPETISKLPAYAFAGSGLVEVVLPQSITNINQDGIFKGCPYLKSVVFHENVKGSVGDEIFMNCASLEYVDFSATTDLYFEPVRGFMNTPSLVTVYFADGMEGMMAESCFENSGLQYLDFSMVEFWGSWARAFANCTKLHTIVMCDNFYDIEVETFLNCSALDGIIHVPYCWLYGSVFNGCTNIDELHFSSGYDAFDYANFVGWTADQKIVLYGWTAADNEDYDPTWDDDCEAEIVEM